MPIKTTTIRNITIGNDVPSGKAYFITLDDGEEKCIPYSVTESRKTTGYQGADSIEVQSWFAEKEGLE